jgi:hypothetical protein
MTFGILRSEDVARRETDPVWLRREHRLILAKGWVQIAGLFALLGQVGPAVGVCWLLTLALGLCLAINRLLWCGAIIVITALCYQAYNGIDWLLVYLNWGHLPEGGTDDAIPYAGLLASILGTIWAYGGSLDELVERKIHDLRTTAPAADRGA